MKKPCFLVYGALAFLMTGANSVVILSPGAVDSDGQYIAGLNDGRVLGMQDKDLNLEKLPGSNLQVYPDKSDN